MVRSSWIIGTLAIVRARSACGRRPTPSLPSMTWSYAVCLAYKTVRVPLGCDDPCRMLCVLMYTEGESPMRHSYPILLLVLALLTMHAHAQEGTPLRLVQTIPLPHVEGRIDHMAVDVQGQRLFVAALGNNTLEIIDLKAGTRLHTIT